MLQTLFRLDPFRLVFLGLIWLAAFVLSCSAQTADAGKRFALVVGNSAYQHVVQLANARADAELIADTLGKLDFNVKLLTDADYMTVNRSLVEYANSLPAGAISFVYFSGHGVQAGNDNYLLPIDADPKTESDLPFVSIASSKLLEIFSKRDVKANIFVFDSCRNNPFEDGKNRSAFGSTTRGMVPIQVDYLGSIIAFSTAPGRVALDGKGKNSPYSSALSDSLLRPGLSIESVFKLTRTKVVGETSYEQVPWENSSLTSEIFLNPAAETAVKTVTECDLLAGHPSDPDRVHAGIDYALLRPEPAILACRADLAADPGNPRLQTLLARALDKAGQYDEALALNRAAAEIDYLGAYHNLGNHYKKGNGVPKDLDKAYDYFVYAAERGHAEDAYNIGILVMEGTPKHRADIDAAKLWLTRAAEQDYPSAFDKLGLIEKDGLAGSKDAAVAMGFFARGAELGDSSAIVNLATGYLKGEGVDQDFARAHDLFRQAAQLRRRSAYTNLGDIYFKGIGRDADPAEAAFWFGLAAREGHDYSTKRLQELTATMDALALEKLEERIQTWVNGDFG